MTRPSVPDGPIDLGEAFTILSFYLREYDVDTRFIVAIPTRWKSMSDGELMPYFSAHKSGKCGALKSLKHAKWCRISQATADSVHMRTCELCVPYEQPR